MAPRSCVVVGSGPNGLAAAITLARAGCRVTVLEAADTIGGGVRSAALTLPGFTHDICSAIHPLGVASPFLRDLPLAEYGLEWMHSPAPLAHPLDDGSAVMLERSLDATCAGLGADGEAWRDLFAPHVRHFEGMVDATLNPLLPPRRPFLMARFGFLLLRSAAGLARARFTGDRARALFAGNAAHAVLPLEQPASASFGLTLGMMGHAVGWPFPRGGSQKIADAMAGYLRSLGGEIRTGCRVSSPKDLPEGDAVLFDVAPRNLERIGRDRLPESYRRALLSYRAAPGAFKLDWALDGPIPWRAAACARAATVHVGGTLDEIAAGESAVARGGHPDRPFVLLAQPSLFDATRAPAGKHTAWAYCHVPNGSAADMTVAIERQVERFAPGFGARIIARHVFTPAAFEAHNANYVGGDIVGGANDLPQLIGRPRFSLHPYTTPVRGWFLCSASTPPGGGVHGMPGFHAARAALRAMS